VAVIVITGLVLWSLNLLPSSHTAAAAYLSLDLSPAEHLGDAGAGVYVADAPGVTASLSRTAVAVSPDGRHIVFAGWRGREQRLYLRALDRPEAEPIARTEGAMNPFFSPNGEWIGFWADGQLKKVALAGGPPVPLCDTEPPLGASWGTDDRIVFGQQTGLWTVPGTGGVPRLLTELEGARRGANHRLPWVLPGGQAILHTLVGGQRRWEEAQIVAQSLTTGERQVLIEGGAHPTYTSSGHLLYVKLGVLWAAPFDPSALELRGPAVPVIEGVAQAAEIALLPVDTGAAQYSVSASGTLVYLPGGLLPPDLRNIVWVDRHGQTEPLPIAAGEYFHPSISPDGRIAISDQGTSSILVVDLGRGVSQKLPAPGVNVGAWHPDGGRIAFGWSEGGARNLFWQPADGSGSAVRLTDSPNAQFAGEWFSQGSELLFVEVRPTTDADILVLNIEEPEEGPRPVFDAPVEEAYPALSPDERWLAYVSDESGQREVYVLAYPSLEGKQQISSDGGYMPAWSPSGDQLFYLTQASGQDEENVMMAVDLALGAELRAGTPRELFRGRYRHSRQIRTYEVAPDGRFLMVERGSAERTIATASLRVVLNWFEELKRLVPTDN
jgi:serine/threonine-protein kinase